jgi:hypothetical protein
MVWARFAREAGFGEAYLRNVENGAAHTKYPHPADEGTPTVAQPHTDDQPEALPPWNP